MSILIVEDHPTNAAIIRRLVYKVTNTEIDVVASASEALGLIHRNHYSLLIVDQLLQGGATGLQLVSAVRMIERYARLPILMVTSDHDPGLRQAATALGVSSVVTKPIDTAEFRRAVEAAFYSFVDLENVLKRAL